MPKYIRGRPRLASHLTYSSINRNMRSKEEILEHIREIIETSVQPAVASHGGFIRLEDFDMETGSVLVQLSGSCSGCAASSITLKLGVENMLKHYVDEVTGVEGVDDPNFNNPYYTDDGRWNAQYD